MKIVHVMNWYIPEMGYQENYLPSEQRKLGHDVEIITTDRFPALQGFKQHVGRIHENRIVETGTFTDKNVLIHRLPTIFEFKRGQIIIKGLKNRLMQLEPDVVQTHGATTFLTIQTALLKEKIDFRLFIDDHTNYQNFNLNLIRSTIYLKILKMLYKQKICKLTEIFIPVTYGSMDFLERELNIPKDMMILLPLGCNTKLFSPSENRRYRIREKMGIKSNNILLITSGKFNPSKDIEILIKVFKKLSLKHNNIKLLILGGWEPLYLDHITSLINRLDLNEIVQFHDFVPNQELPDYYNAADIGIWPGTNTITTIEALSVGLPVVVSKDLTTKHMISNNNGYNFERGNEKELTSVLDKLIKNEKIRKTMGKNSRELAEIKLSWEVLAKKTIDMYSR